MLPVEAHLVLNHVPLVALVIGLVFFIAGLKQPSGSSQHAGLRIFVATGVAGLLVSGSGLVSASVLAEAPWLDSDALSRHQLAGILTLVVLLGLGTLAGALSLRWRNTPASSARTNVAVLFLAIAGLSASMWTAYLGGTLRHTELGRSAPTVTRKAETFVDK